jgi:hypothetical protein
MLGYMMMLGALYEKLAAARTPRARRAIRKRIRDVDGPYLGTLKNKRKRVRK